LEKTEKREKHSKFNNVGHVRQIVVVGGGLQNKHFKKKFPDDFHHLFSKMDKMSIICLIWPETDKSDHF